jgi:putative tricarboxylic transport membrane protein
MELLNNLILGANVALSFWGLFYCLIGVSFGTLIGVLPGVGPLAVVSLLLPITFNVDPTYSIIMLGGIYYGAAYGGSITSILLNLPGTTNTAVTCIDGYPMTRQGRAGVALFITTVASFIGSVFGLILLIGFAPELADFALLFGPWEYFSLMVLGLVAATSISSGRPFRSLASVTIGILFGLVGTDIYVGVQRFTFGALGLFDGFNVAVIAMGLFGVREVINEASILDRPKLETSHISYRSMIPTREDISRSWKSMLRGTWIGAAIGIMPGAGSTLASFLSYTVEKKSSRRQEEFGKGAIEGVAGPEAANNAAVQTAFIPTLALGIPGDAVMALMLAALTIHGIVPGPTLFTQHQELFWGVVISFLVGNILLVILNLPLIGIWLRVLSVPYQYLYPLIIVFVAIGVYSIRGSPFDVYMAMMFGAVGYIFFLLQIEAAPLILGFVLGPLMEHQLRRAMVISAGDWSVFVTRPLSAFLAACTISLLAWMTVSTLVKARRQRRAAIVGAD